MNSGWNASNLLSLKSTVVYCTDSDVKEPFLVIKAIKYTTGRHGHGKIRLEGRTYFTNERFQEILQSDAKIYALYDHPGYQMRTGVIVSVMPKSRSKKDGIFVIQLRSPTYETWTLEVGLSFKENLEVCKPQMHLEYQKLTVEAPSKGRVDTKTYYKLKSVFDLSEDNCTRINTIIF